jgi:hypothetical protein
MGYTGQRPSAIPLTSSDIVDGTISNADLAGSITSAKITSLDAAKLTGSVPSSALTNVDLSQLEMNQALLAFKIASSNQLAKFSMVDQVIDEYQDATGIDAGASTNERAAGATTAKYYDGSVSSSVSPTVSGNYDSTATDGDYTYYKWTTVRSDGTYTTNTAQDYEYLVVGGGGAGGGAPGTYPGGGGGAGGYRAATGFAIAATTISGITVGAGGAGVSVGSSTQNSGSASVFSTISSAGGGAGGVGNTTNGIAGGSGGGGPWTNSSLTPPAGNTPSTTPSQGNAGGMRVAPNGQSGGGGGAGGVGLNSTATSASYPATAGGGGAGLQNDITGANLFYAGGGGGSYAIGGSSIGGIGTNGNTGGATAGAVNTGSGGGGTVESTFATGSGGSGIVIIRRLTSATTITGGGNLTLQSVATTAESAPTTADLVVLIEDGAGTATVNTDIKGFVSRDGSAFSSAVTFVDEGDWGTSKRILVARNIDISGITTGTAMKYKLTTHNQSASSKETRIHATSLAWA